MAGVPPLIPFPVPGAAGGGQQALDPGELPPILFIPAGPGAGGTPQVQVIIAKIYVFPVDTVVVPTGPDMQRCVYTYPPIAWRERYPGANMEAWNRTVHYNRAVAPPVSLLAAVGSARKSPSFGMVQNNAIVMVNTPSLYVPGPVIARYPGNGDILHICFRNALAAAIAPIGIGVPAAILAALPGAIGPAPAAALIAGPAPGTRIDISFPYFGNQLGWTDQLFSQIILDLINDRFFDPGTPPAIRAANCARVSGINIIVRRHPRKDIPDITDAITAAANAIVTFGGFAPWPAPGPGPPGGGGGGGGGGGEGGGDGGGNGSDGSSDDASEPQDKEPSEYVPSSASSGPSPPPSSPRKRRRISLGPRSSKPTRRVPPGPRTPKPAPPRPQRKRRPGKPTKRIPQGSRV